MSLNRSDLIKKLNKASSELLREKGYISFVDVLIKTGKLKQEDYEDWRFGRIPYLEKAITVNLAKVSHMLRTLQENAKHGGLKPSKTAYMSWGKGPKRPLGFSKSGDPNIEQSYATHFLKLIFYSTSRIIKQSQWYTCTLIILGTTKSGFSGVYHHATR